MAYPVTTDAPAAVVIPAARSTSRFEELNGIRGWAALSVVAFHMIWETFGVFVPDFRNPFTGFFLDASLAIYVFFVLSGEAMSSAYFMGGGDTAVARLATKRYFRLTIPIAAACLITYALYRAGVTYNVEAGRVVDRSDWLGAWLNPAPDFRGVIKYILIDVYTSKPGDPAVIPFLWTMQIELKGSMLVFALLIFFPHLRHPWILVSGLIGLIVIFARSYGHYACFLAGLSFASLRSNGFFSRAQNHNLALPVSWVVIGTIAVLDGLSHWKMVGREWLPFIAIILLFAVFCNRALCDFFSSRISVLLGKLSFPIYLVQFPFLVSVTSGAICYARNRGELSPSMALMIAIASIFGCAMAAYAFEPIETLTRWVGARVVASVLTSNAPGRHQ